MNARLEKKLSILDLIDEEFIEEAAPGNKVIGKASTAFGALGKVFSFVSSGIGAAVSVAVVALIVIGAIVGPQITEYIKSKTEKPETTYTEETTVPHTESDPGVVDPENVENGIVTNAAELEWVLNNAEMSKNYTVTAKKLDMTGLSWSGIDNYMGDFDFGGCRLSGVSYPLFISVKGGSVKNLIIENSNFEYTNTRSTNDKNAKTGEQGNPYFAPVVCYARDVTVSNVVIESTVTVKTEILWNYGYHAGIIGKAEGDDIIISNCQFKGVISTDSFGVFLGGIAGEIICTNDPVYSENLYKFSAVLKNCVNSGRIEAVCYGSDAPVAGIVGSLSGGAVHRCANYADVRVESDGYAGGIVGAIYTDSNRNSLISECINTGSIYGEDHERGKVRYRGGIVGYAFEYIVWIRGCVNVGKIEVGEGFAMTYGGIVGLGKNTVAMTNCFNLISACDIFAHTMHHGDIDPSDKEVQNEYEITNCANCSTLDELYSKISSACPDVFVRDGESLKFADR